MTALRLEDAAADNPVQFAHLLDVALDQRRRRCRREAGRRDRGHRMHLQRQRWLLFHRQGIARGNATHHRRQRCLARLVRRRPEGAELGHGTAVGRRLFAQPAPGAGDEGPGIGRPCDLRRRPHRHTGAAAEIEPVRHQRARRGERQQQKIAARPRAGEDVVVQRFQRRRNGMPGQLADHDDAEAAVGKQRLGKRMARGGVGIGFGRIEAQRLLIGRRQLDELECCQRRAVALAADDQLLHGTAARRSDTGQQLA